MRKLKNILMATVAAVAVVGSLSTALYVAELSAKIDQVSRTSRADMNYLRGCIRDLEGELTASLIDRVLEHMDEMYRPTEEVGLPGGGESAPDGGIGTDETETDGADGTAAETAAETAADTAGETVGETAAEVWGGGEAERESLVESDALTESESITERESLTETEAVTLPTHNGAETEASDEGESAPLRALYTVAAHEGRIGVFDETGRLIRTVNVFLFALPEADREALEVGIPAFTREEMTEIVARYE